ATQAAQSLTTLYGDTPRSPSPEAGVGEAARSSTPKPTVGATPSNPSPKAVIGEAVERGRVALVFCGNGSQWAGMGADLMGEPAFRKAVEAVDGELVNRLGWSVLEELTLPPDRWRL